MRSPRVTVLAVAVLVLAVFLPQLVDGTATIQPGPRQIVVVRETAEDSPEFNAMKLELRASEAMSQHTLYFYDDDQDAAEGFPPGVTISTLEGRELYHGSIPTSAGDFVALVKRYGG